MAVYSNIVIDQGADYTASIDVTDADGDAVDLTGHTGKGQIRKTYSSSTAVDFTVNVKAPATNGVLTIGLTNTQTNAMKAGRYVYDVELRLADSTLEKVHYGIITVLPEVTKV